MKETLTDILRALDKQCEAIAFDAFVRKYRREPATMAEFKEWQTVFDGEMLKGLKEE